MRDRSMIGTTLRVASFALALGLIASPAAAQTYGGYGTVNGGHSAAGTGGGAGGESGSGSTTESYSGEFGMSNERQPRRRQHRLFAPPCTARPADAARVRRRVTVSPRT